MPEQPHTLSDRARALSADLLDWIGTRLHRLGVHPDAITVTGLVLVIVASGLIGSGQLQAGGVLLLVGLPLDAVDGAVARASGRTGQFGAVLDSTLDRYADGFIFGAIGYHFAVQDQLSYLLLALLALIGSFTVSYVRARAEGVGVVVRVGWFTRLERLSILLVALLIPATLIVAMWLLAIGTNVTGLQRLWYVHNTLADRED